jgi:hypothetical protein
MTKSYVPPKELRCWTKDSPGEELYVLLVYDDYTVCSAYGRYGHSSGSKYCSWDDFLHGEIDALVLSAHGAVALHEAKDFVRDTLEKNVRFDA